MSNRSASNTATQSDPTSERNHHDIPPQIVIDVGSFSIETDRAVANGPADSTDPPQSTRKATYKVANKNVRMMLIKIVRTDDGAILYQNFDANGAEVEFTVRSATGDGDKVITIKAEEDDDHKDTVVFNSGNVGYLNVRKIPPSDVINGRQFQLHNDFTINNVTVRKKEGEGVGEHYITLFSHGTPTSPEPTSQASPVHPEYSDKRYRVFILVEEKDS